LTVFHTFFFWQIFLGAIFARGRNHNLSFKMQVINVFLRGWKSFALFKVSTTKSVPMIRKMTNTIKVVINKISCLYEGKERGLDISKGKV
jgi:hypothetical protein